jgi:hypothetical protein
VTAQTQSAATVPAIRAFVRYDLDKFLPHVARRVLAAEFTSQSDMARAYGINKATTTKWKKRAVRMGLTDARCWDRGLTLGRLAHELAA